MTGVLCAIAGSGSGAYSATMTVGTYNSGGKVPVTYDGYASASSGPPAAFGSFSPTAYKGTVIRALYESDLSFNTTFAVTGNQTSVSGFLNDITIDGTSLGAIPTPSYISSGNYTQWVFSTSGLITTGTQTVIVR